MKDKQLTFISVSFVIGFLFTVGYPYIDYLLIGVINFKLALYLLTIFSILGVILYVISVYLFLYYVTNYSKNYVIKKKYLNIIMLIMVLIAITTSLRSLFIVGMSWG